MSINQVTLTCVYLALNPLLPKEIYLKILAIKKFIPISRPPSSSGKVICSLIIWLQPFIFLFFVFGGRDIFYTVTGRALFFSFLLICGNGRDISHGRIWRQVLYLYTQLLSSLARQTRIPEWLVHGKNFFAVIFIKLRISSV